MRIEVLNTGTELLLGNTQNTHCAWLGKELFGMGLRIARQATVPDGMAIREAFEEMVMRADVILITGGLGPTSDDLTREIVAEALGLELHLDEQAQRNLESFFRVRGKPMAAVNIRQAMVPTGADVMDNPNGTAPGLYIPPRINGRSHCAVFLLPGPPRELYPMFHNEVQPRLRALSGISEQVTATEIKFTGVGESEFHHAIDAALAAIPGLEYGYCARISELDLRLIGSPAAIAAGKNLAVQSFSDFMISDNGSSLETVVINQLIQKKATLALAESCTGGLIASRLTNVPGASEVFTYGWVTYSNQAKQSQLGVPESMISEFGAVSENVARAMAEGALKMSAADYALSITGIAGPSGGSDAKPVGTAWLALASEGEATLTYKVFHPRQRKDFKQAASQSALEMIRRKLKGIRI